MTDLWMTTARPPGLSWMLWRISGPNSEFIRVRLGYMFFISQSGIPIVLAMSFVIRLLSSSDRPSHSHK